MNSLIYTYCAQWVSGRGHWKIWLAVGFSQPQPVSLLTFALHLQSFSTPLVWVDWCLSVLSYWTRQQSQSYCLAMQSAKAMTTSLILYLVTQLLKSTGRKTNHVHHPLTNLQLSLMNATFFAIENAWHTFWLTWSWPWNCGATTVELPNCFRFFQNQI